MDMHTLMHQFSQFDGARVGRGPKHPTEPHLKIADEIDAFLKEYPFLWNDQGYVSFLQCYAGASILTEDHAPIVDILGFAGDSISTYMFEMEGDIVDEEGYLLFGYILLQTTPSESQQISFGFDATQERRPGIYRFHDPLQRQWHWYCSTFLEWLERLIKYEGRLDK